MVEAQIQKYLVPVDEAVVLDRWPTSDTLDMDKEAAKAELATTVTRMAFIQHRLMAEAQRSLLVILQGRDASGKDGLIRHVMTGFNPAGVRVTSFKVPSGAERDHDYLWRCHAACPAKGEVGVWNRSHYEDVLVPRVKKLVPDEVWTRRFRHIREFERMLTDEGTVVLKFYLHVSHEIQRQRLQKRVDNPESSWKHDPSDISDRSIWHLYEEAYEDVLAQTNRPDAPWFILPGDVKWARDLIFARILLTTLETMDPQLPQPDASLRHITVT